MNAPTNIWSLPEPGYNLLMFQLKHRYLLKATRCSSSAGHSTSNNKEPMFALENLAVIIVVPDEHIPMVREEYLAAGPRLPRFRKRTAVEFDVTGSIGDVAEAIQPKTVVVVVAPPCVIVALAASPSLCES